MSLSFIIWQVYIIFRSSDSLHSWGDNNNNNELLSCKIRSFQIDPIFDFEDKDSPLVGREEVDVISKRPCAHLPLLFHDLCEITPPGLRRQTLPQTAFWAFSPTSRNKVNLLLLLLGRYTHECEFFIVPRSTSRVPRQNAEREKKALVQWTTTRGKRVWGKILVFEFFCPLPLTLLRAWSSLVETDEALHLLRWSNKCVFVFNEIVSIILHFVNPTWADMKHSTPSTKELHSKCT